jgi:hypothetical protein
VEEQPGAAVRKAGNREQGSGIRDQGSASAIKGDKGQYLQISHPFRKERGMDGAPGELAKAMRLVSVDGVSMENWQ